MVKSDALHKAHIRESIERIQSYVDGKRDLLENDRKTFDAVLRNLQTLSESVQKLSDSFKAQYPHIPWRKIAGFRNILIHDYLGDLSSDMLWEVIVHRLPDLYTTMLDNE